ncbi:MAG: hypothetical protein ACWGON_06910 [Gemmatimonadota bacterium]
MSKGWAVRIGATFVAAAWAGLSFAEALSAQSPGTDPETYRIEARAEVLATIRAALSTLGDRNVAAHREFFLPSATVIAVTERDGERSTLVRNLEESINSIAAVTVPMNERIWDPEVRVDGGVAIAWAPYDFYIDGGFSHCGHDAFQLIRTDGGWKLSSIIYTVQQPPDCALHPDGPPLVVPGFR